MKTDMKREKWILGWMFLLLSAFIILPSGKAEAASKKPTCTKKQTVYYVDISDAGEATCNNPQVSSSLIYIKNLASNAKITNIKSSNKKVSAASGLDGWGNGNFKAKAVRVYLSDYGVEHSLKSGETAKISFTVQQNGKSYNLSCKVTFKPRKSPVKTLKLGDSTNYAKSFTGNWMKSVTCSKSTAKLTVKAASGYKIKSVYAYYKDGSKKKVTNGTKITITNLWYIEIAYDEKKPANYQKPIKWTIGTGSPQNSTVFLYVND